MNFHRAEKLLKETFAEVRDQHSSAGHDYIKTHWKRYAHLVCRLPALSGEHRVLEIGASILSNLIRRRFGCEMHTLYHELEPEWPSRFAADGITGYPVEMMRDPLPVKDNSFDFILFNEVMEHFPLKPDFVMRQIIAKLKPRGTLLFSVPNFATSEKRLGLLRGTNPQDPMDEKFVYFAHHREPVMGECVDLIKRCGGLIRKGEWSDCDVAPGWFPGVWCCLRHLRHRKPHRIIHQLFPSMRSYIIIEVARNAGFDFSVDAAPPLLKTGEFIGRKERCVGQEIF